MLLRAVHFRQQPQPGAATAAAITPKPPPVSLLLTFLVARAMTKKTWLHGEDKPSCIILTALPAAAAVREKKAGEPSQCQMKK